MIRRIIVAIYLVCSAYAVRATEIPQGSRQESVGTDNLEVVHTAGKKERQNFFSRLLTGRKKKKLLQERARLQAEVDSLRQLIEEFRERKTIEDSLRSEIIEMYEENEDKIGAGISPEEYTPEISDSLLSLWYMHHRDRTADESGEYNMDSIRLSSSVPDEVYLKRLSAINSFITLPYNETVRNYMVMYSEKMPTKMQLMLGLSRYYFPIFEEIFNRYGMPEELKYMAVIESAFNPVAVSRAGAKGMWQFMYNTGKSYGLKINSYVDERLDPVKSAEAAAKYLRDAYNIFGDWNLAISSYNCGPGNVNKAIKRSGSRDFWQIYEYLPRETRGYVPAFVGAMYAFSYYKEHGLVPEQIHLPAHVDTFHIDRMLHFRQISEVAGIPSEALKELNPQYVHEIIPGNEATCILRIPFQFTSSFIENEDSIYTYKAKELFNPATLQSIREASAEQQRIVYKVKSGDYLGKIAARHRVSVKDLRKWNRLRNNNLRVGQKLVIYRRGAVPAPVAPSKPSAGNADAASATSGGSLAISAANPGTSSASSRQASGDSNQSASFRNGEEIVYIVRKGDSLYEIAKRYPGVSAKDIMEYNKIGSSIRPGMKIRIPKP